MNDAQLEYIYKELDVSFNKLDTLGQLKNKKIFITGASGFIGKWLLLCLAFLNDKHDLNINIVATSKKMLQSSILKRLKKGNIAFYNLNVCDPFEIPNDVNIIIHLAGNPDRRVHASDPLSVIKTNVDGTRNVLDAATRLEHLNNILVFSSGLISTYNIGYNTSTSEKQKNIDTLSFTSSYLDSKRLQENICHIFSRKFQLPIGIIRPYTFVGPLQKLDRPWAINDFISSAINARDIKILGDPQTTKSFLYPTEMLKMIFEFLFKGDFEVPLELGSSNNISIIEIANIISTESGCNVKISNTNGDVRLDKNDFFVLENKQTHISYTNIIQKSIHWHNLWNVNK